MESRIHPSAEVSPTAIVGAGSQIWHLVQIREHAVLGADCVVGRGAYIGTGVVIGDRCKIQNYAQVFEPAHLDSGVFIGPGAVLTNDTHPRAVTPEGLLKGSEDWSATGVTVKEGASIGAQATCVAPVTVGSWAVVAAGAVVTKDVPDFALVAGVPARQVGWVGRSGKQLHERDGSLWCPDTNDKFRLEGGKLQRVDPDD